MAKTVATPPKADATLPPHFEVVVGGEYYVPSPSDPKKRSKKPYQETFRVSEAGSAMSIIVNRLLMPRLRKKDPTCIRFRTHHAISMTPVGFTEYVGIPVRMMTRSLLLKILKDEKLPLIPVAFPGLDDLREAVLEAREIRKDEKVAAEAGDDFIGEKCKERWSKLAARQEKMLGKTAQEDLLAQLNPDLGNLTDLGATEGV